MRLHSSTMLLIGCLGFIIGVGVASFWYVPFEGLITVGAIGSALLVLSVRYHLAFVLGISVLAVGLGILRYQAAILVFTSYHSAYYNEQSVTFTGIVDAEPDVRADHVKLTVAVDTVDGHTASGKVLVNAKLYPRYEYGNQLAISCTLRQPGIIESDDGRDFDYGNYLARFGIYSTCYRPDITLLARDHGSVIMASILHVKSVFVERVTQSIAEPEASFVGGLILGARKSIPDWLIDAFNKTGTTHIIALSGYNITIIAVFVQNLSKTLRIHRRYGFWISVVAILFFVILTGAPASVTRAGIMGGLVLVARQLGRMSRVTNLLVLAAVIMLLINPRVLVYDAGFQLSFLATIGLVYLSPLLERAFRFIPQQLEFRSNTAATLSAIIMTTPLILFTFGRLSIVAPIVNVIILPLIPFAMALGFITGIVGMIFFPLGQLVGWIAWALLRFILSVIELFSRLPFVAVDVPVIHWTWGIALYIGLAILLWRYNKKPLARRPAAVP